jgi:hypothetical protein
MGMEVPAGNVMVWIATAGCAGWAAMAIDGVHEDVATAAIQLYVRNRTITKNLLELAEVSQHAVNQDVCGM